MNQSFRLLQRTTVNLTKGAIRKNNNVFVSSPSSNVLNTTVTATSTTNGVSSTSSNLFKISSTSLLSSSSKFSTASMPSLCSNGAGNGNGIIGSNNSTKNNTNFTQSLNAGFELLVVDGEDADDDDRLHCSLQIN